MLGLDREPGIMVCTLNELFQHVEKTTDDTIYHITMAYLEVSVLGVSTCQEAEPERLPTALIQNKLARESLSNPPCC